MDWNPDYGGNPDQCRRDGMVFNPEAPDMGKTNKECCKVIQQVTQDGVSKIERIRQMELL